MFCEEKHIFWRTDKIVLPKTLLRAPSLHFYGVVGVNNYIWGTFEGNMP
jgi:hypothetical protein